MASIDNAVTTQPRRGVHRMKRHNLKVDMTPMVDLGFLLIAFFVITTELSKPTVMNLAMPKDGINSDLACSKALTVLLDNNKIYYYQCDWDKAEKEGMIFTTNFSAKGLRRIINEKQRELDSRQLAGRDELMLLIKPASSASYKNVVDVLDEATISIVKKYAIVPLSAGEQDWLKRHSGE
jgi:biopolymer transport protein ExbD